MKKKVNILGVNFDQVSVSETVKKIGEMIEKGGCYQVGTINPEYVVKAQTSKQLMRVIAKMDLVVPDGVGIILAARLKGLGRLERIRGGDLVERLASLCARKGYKIGLVGGERGVAKKALQVLKKKYPGLRGFADSGPDFAVPPSEESPSTSLRATSEEGLPASQGDTSDGDPKGLLRGGGIGERVIKKIEKEKPQVLLTALSFKGPIWIESLRKGNLSLVGIEVGGVFNYLAGKAKKPSKIIQKIGLEWLWRLITEPWRWKRQLKLMRFLWLIIRQS